MKCVLASALSTCVCNVACVYGAGWMVGERTLAQGPELVGLSGLGQHQLVIYRRPGGLVPLQWRSTWASKAVDQELQCLFVHITV